MFGAGSKAIGRITVGNNVRVGANAIIATDIPDYATVVMDKPRIILRKEEKNDRVSSHEKGQCP